MADDPANDEAAADDELVAYLDGELDGEEAGAVETKLAHDEAARSRADVLRKTYDLLDYLPKPEPSPDFASRTLTKLEPSPTATSTPSLSASQFAVVPRSGGQAFIVWASAAVLAGVLGYFGHLLAKPHLEAKTSAPTLQQVRMLERLPLTLGVDDLSFLQKLEESELFSDHEPDADAKPPAVESVTSAELAKLEETFKKLPAARQQQLRQLDDDLAALEPAQQARLGHLLERYGVWLDRLPEAYRREILAAPAPTERVDAVRMIRVRLWREHLPQAVKARLAEAANAEEADRIFAEYRKQEIERRQIWLLARQQWANATSRTKPFPFEDAALAAQVEEYVATVLKPRLNPSEQARLDDHRKETAEGGFVAWYLYGVAILSAVEQHPMLPEPKVGKPPSKVDDFPPEFLRKLRLTPSTPKAAPKRELRDLPQHGRWPEFAEVIAKEAADRNVTVPIPLGPSRPGEFKPDAEAAYLKLLPKLTPKEKGELEVLQGKWPAEPKLFIDLARKYDVNIPGVTLPGSPQQWAKVYASKLKR